MDPSHTMIFQASVVLEKEKESEGKLKKCKKIKRNMQYKRIRDDRKKKN